MFTMNNNSFTLSDYLLTRLADLGISHLFGVPGDYNLGFLDRVLDDDRVEWIGCANELNASYAADGYARLRGFGALATTYGVGELSAVNGMAGARAENVPVIQITGAPSTTAIAASAPVHHTFGDGDYSRFIRIGEEITAAAAFLSASNATAEIDRVLTTAIVTRQPVQITVPSDIALLRVEAPTSSLLAVVSREGERVEADRSRLQRHLEDLLLPARSVVGVAGHEAARFGLAAEVRALVDETQIATAFLHRGKGVLDESAPLFLGLYAGELSTGSAREAVETADAVIVFGTLFTGGVVPFTSVPRSDRMIEIGPEETRVAGTPYAVAMLQSLRIVEDVLAARTTAEAESVQLQQAAPSTHSDDEPLSQASTWAVLTERLPAHQTVSAEAGTSYYALLQSRLPEDTTVVAQGMWSSIGYTFPAALGAQVADPSRRVLLVIGDGSLQLTAQEFGTFQRAGATPIIVVINNDGYTVERAIHGAQSAYNDIAPWNWQSVAPTLGATDALCLRATTVAEFRSALAQAQSSDRLVLVEAVLPVLDVPPLLQAVADAVSRRNGYLG